MKQAAKQRDRPSYNLELENLSPDKVGEKILKSYGQDVLTERAFWDSLTLAVRYKVLVFYYENQENLDVPPVEVFHFLLTPDFIQTLEDPLLTRIAMDLTER